MIRFWLFQLQVVIGFMRNDDIILNLPPCHESVLLLGDDAWKNWFQSISQKLRQNLQKIVAKTDGSELIDRFQEGNFRDQNNVCLVEFVKWDLTVKERCNNLVNILLHNVPVLAIEHTWEVLAIRARCLGLPSCFLALTISSSEKGLLISAFCSLLTEQWMLSRVFPRWAH